MSTFDIAQFEHRVDDLLEAYQSLQIDYRALKSAYDEQLEQNRETRERLTGIIERIRLLEKQAELETAEKD